MAISLQQAFSIDGKMVVKVGDMAGGLSVYKVDDGSNDHLYVVNADHTVVGAISLQVDCSANQAEITDIHVVKM